ncbi:MAG TPA: hypothetical protein VJ208_02345 [Candidatus Nanoarchaeia archaeon]|nr:hypothetical protein [Candidatus Nanoarchaeia archaeon]
MKRKTSEQILMDEINERFIDNAINPDISQTVRVLSQKNYPVNLEYINGRYSYVSEVTGMRVLLPRSMS